MESLDPSKVVHNEQDSPAENITGAANPEVNAPLNQEAGNVSESDTLDSIINFQHENSEEVSSDEFDYSTLGKDDLIKAMANLIEINMPDKIRKDVESIRVCFYKKLKADIEKARKTFAESGGDPEAFQIEEDQDELRLKELLKKYRQLRSEQTEKLEADKEKNLAEKHRIIEELKALTVSNEFANETFHKFRELQNSWRSIGPVPQSHLKDLWETYHHHVEVFYNYIKINKELRDLDLKKNLEQKIILCEKAEELLMDPSIVKAFKTLQKLHEEWREIGPVVPEMKNEIWERFKDVTSKLNKKHQEYFESQKDDQKKNLEQKIVLCEKAEEITAKELGTASEWDKSSQEMVELQKTWRTIGFAPKKDNAKIYNRFRSVCDQFFIKKRDYFAQSREEHSNNMQLKEDLCIQAEALKESTKWKETTEDMIELQKKWKQTGPVPRKYSDSVWKRFRTACDYFFDKKAEHFNSVDSDYAKNLADKLALIEEITQFSGSDSAEENFETMKEFQRRWSRIGFVPIKHKDDIQKKYREAISKKFDELHLEDSHKNLKNYRHKLEQVSGSPKGDRKLKIEREKMFVRIKQLESEIITLENNIGFFSKSSNAESMITEVRKRIERTKEEIDTIEEKIRIIDQMDEQ